MGQCFSILIAGSRFPHEPQLASLLTPEDDVDGLAEALASFGPLLRLKNRPLEEVFQEIDQVYRRAAADDVVFLFYAGYALLGDHGELSLAMANSRCHGPAKSALSLDRVAESIEASAVRKTVLVMDCAYRDCTFGATLTPGLEVALARFSRHGAVLSTETRFDLPRERRHHRFGLFTQRLIETFEGRREIGVQELYRRLAERWPKAEFYAGSANDIPLARDAAANAPPCSSVPPYKFGAALESDGTSVLAIAYSPDGRWLAAAGSDGTVSLWDCHTGEQGRSLHGHEGAVCALAFAPGGKQLASGGVDRLVRVWDVATQSCVHVLAGHYGAVLSLSFDPRNGRLASAGYDGVVRLWDTDAGLCQAQWRIGGQAVSALAFHPEGGLLAIANGSETQMWDTASGAASGEPLVHGAPVQSLCFDREGRRLASGGQNGCVQVWSVAEGACEQTLALDAGAVLGLCSHPLLTVFAAATVEGVVSLSSWTENDAPYRCRTACGALHGVAFHPQDGSMAAAGVPGRIEIWRQRRPYTGDPFSSGREER